MDAHALIKAAEDSRAVSYVFASATALICYDICTVFSREVSHVWRVEWSTSNALYLLARYHGALVMFIGCAVNTRLQTSLSLCKKWFWFNFTLGGTNILTIIINAILTLRLYSLYDRSNRVLYSLSLLQSASCMATIIAIANNASSMGNGAYLSPSGIPMYGCLTHPSSTKKWLMLWWLSPILVTALLLILMLIKFHENMGIMHQEGTLDIWSAARTFWDDGTCAAFLLLLVLVTGMTIVLRFEGPLRSLYFPLVTVAFSVLGSRLILDAKERKSNSSEDLTVPATDTRFLTPIPRRSSHTTLR